MFFKKKQIQQPQIFNSLAFADLKQEPVTAQEPLTLAKIRLEGEAKDKGAKQGLKLYNQHKTKVNNQWVNPLQSINSGYGNAQLSYYNYQNVNYFECYALAQDPLFNKIFNILSRTPFKDGGEVISKDFDDKKKDILDKAICDYNVTEKLIKALRSQYVCGGCLVFMDFGQEDLEEPLDLDNMDMKSFKGFRHIDPINLAAVEVNTVEPAKANYMQPNKWYVIGLGTVHHSHFLKFEDNVPELMMRPMTMYFGMPLTLLIKQDVANSNLASQGLANLMNRFRYLYLQTGDENFTGAGAQNFRRRLETMSLVQDNFGIYPLKSTETMQQFTTALTGMNENCEFFYQIIASKTDITLSILLGKGAQGLSGTLEGERENFYDRIRSMQEAVKPNLLKMYGIVYGKVTDGKFFKFDDYVFNPLQQASEKEKAENFKSYSEVAKSLIEIGVKTEDVLGWLQKFKDFRLDNVSLDTDTDGLLEYDDKGDSTSNNYSMVDNEKWITIHPNGEENKGRPLLLEDGETPKEAIDRVYGKKEPKIEIVRQTEKAYLLKKDGVEFWVQKRWYNEDTGELTKGGLNAFEKKKEEKEWADNWKKDYDEKQKKKQEFVKSGYSLPKKADYESEKAYGYDVLIDFYDAEVTKKHRIFIPKSVVKEGKIPSWLINKKFDEIDDAYSNYSKWGGWNILHNPFESEEETKSNNNAITGASVYSVIDGELCVSFNGEDFIKTDNGFFIESEHPRDENGQFAEKEVESLSKEERDKDDNVLKFKDTESIEKFFGETGLPLLERKRHPVQKWQSLLSVEQKRTIAEYAADMYADINNYLRGRDYQKSYDVEKAVQNIDKAISEFPLEENIRVYRAINPDAFKGKELKSLVGTNYTDDAFMSSSPYLYSTAVNKDLIFEITVPKGKGRGAWINGLSGFKGQEYEFLLKKGGNYKITGYYEKDGKKFLKMEMITDD